jgi:hypothetical protein
MGDLEEAAQVIKPARDELIRQAAQGAVVHNDDTSMRVLMLKRDPRTSAGASPPAASCRSTKAGGSRST